MAYSHLMCAHAHPWVLQERDSQVTSGHGRPLPEGWTVTLRWRISVPPPQVREHAPQASKSGSITQSTSQTWALHTWVWELAPQIFPPLVALLLTVRVNICEPPPQASLQVPTATQSDCSQSTGHGWRLHGKWAVRAGHALPP